MAKAPSLGSRVTHERRAARPAWRIACCTWALLASLLAAPEPRAQGPDNMFVRLAPTVVAAPASETLLRIDVGPPRAVPDGSFVSLRGLPRLIAVPDAHGVGPGAWAVPLRALPLLKVRIPPEVSGQSEIVVSLIALDGRLLAQARATLIVQGAAGVAAAPAPKRSAIGSLPARPELTAEERRRAERLQARGEAYLANGNIIAARDFFERAADAGLAAGALLLAVTYDPAGLEWLKAPGVTPDRALARKWYERARDLGAIEAEERLELLDRN